MLWFYVGIGIRIGFFFTDSDSKPWIPITLLLTSLLQNIPFLKKRHAGMHWIGLAEYSHMKGLTCSFLPAGHLHNYPPLSCSIWHMVTISLDLMDDLFIFTIDICKYTAPSVTFLHCQLRPSETFCWLIRQIWNWLVPLFRASFNFKLE